MQRSTINPGTTRMPNSGYRPLRRTVQATWDASARGNRRITPRTESGGTGRVGRWMADVVAALVPAERVMG